MPSVSGWALRPVIQAMRSWGLEGFYALGIGLGFATYRNLHELQALGISFLCPRYRAGLCDALYFSIVDRPGGFYALGIGLGFATC